jgi:glycosyltransferase involved in cell wall biosynthesis
MPAFNATPSGAKTGERADVLMVTRHFALRWGGGEHSLAAVIDELRRARPDWTWTVSDGGFDPPDRLRPLPLLQLVIRRGGLRRAAVRFAGQLALVQSLVGPTLLNALPRSVATVYFMRDVRYWDEWSNHETGLRRVAKALYRAALTPALAAFCTEVRRALARADLVVANSTFMAERIRAFCGRDALIVYPRTLVAAAPLPEGPAVGIVGDGADKGGLILRALAERFPDVTFRFHARHPASLPLPRNVVVAGWESDLGRLYRGLWLVLMPSQVAEAYGRVALEALGHGVPVLVSSIGGLPETVPEPTWTVADYGNIETWCAAFADAWQATSTRRAAAYAFAVARSHIVDEQHRRLVEHTLALM